MNTSGDPSFGDKGLAALCTGLMSSKSLQSLDLENKDIRSEGAVQLAQVLAQNRSLQRLNLARNPLGDAGLASLAQLPWACLSNLDLRACGIAADGIASLAAAAAQGGLGSLSFLDLSHNGLGPDAGTALAMFLRSTPALHELRLSSCKLGDDGVQGVSGGLALHPYLHSLNLSDNGCGSVSGCVGWGVNNSYS